MNEPSRFYSWKSAVPVALIGAAGYALLELAFVAERNQLLPWSREHAALGALFFLLHATVAVAAALIGAILTRVFFAESAPGFAWFAPLAVLVAIHALTHYRERVNALPRDVVGTLATAGIVALFLLGAWAHAHVLRNRPGWARGAALAFACAILAIGVFRVATARPPAEEAPLAPPRAASDKLAAADSGARVLFFGFDGATWDVLDELIAAGRMPHLASLAARGRTFSVETIRPTFSPIIWTSASTGKTRFQHGIHDVVQATLPGGTTLHRSLDRTAFLTKTSGVFLRFLDGRGLVKLVPYRSSQIRATSIFEAASEAGLPATQIEWFVSWPARTLSGTCVSDRFHLQARGMEPLPGAVAPDSANAELRELVVSPEAVPLEEVLALVDTEGMTAAQIAAWAEKRHAFVEEMRINLARDLTTRNVALALLEREPNWRVFSPYFRAVDVSHHLTWKYRGASGDAAALEGNPDLRMRTVVDRYHEIMDRILGEVLARIPEDAAVLVLSDHGFEDRYGHSQAPDGFAVAAGGPFVPGETRDRLKIYEIAPTLAAILGLPVPEDIAAKPRVDLINPAFLAAHPIRTVTTWEWEGRLGSEGLDDGVSGAMDEEEIDRLRAIGYIR